MKKIENTKKKITYILVLFIFLLFFSLGIGFFLFNFFYNQTNQIENLEKIKKESLKNKNKIINILTIEKNYLKEIRKINNKIDIKKINKKSIDEFLDFFEKEVYKKIEQDEKKTDYFYELDPKIKNKYKIFSKKYIIYDIFRDEILFTNISDFKQINIKKINTKNDKLQKINNYFIYNLDFIDDSFTNSYKIIFLQKNEFLKENLIQKLFFYGLFSFFFIFIIYFLSKKIINYIFKPVEKNLDDMENFTHFAGHELKNPLASVNSSIQLLKEFQEYKPELINETLSEIKKMDKLVNIFKDFSIIENNKQKEKININNEIKKILNENKEILKKKKIKIFLKENKNLILNINKYHFYILFSNLLSNAVKYSKENPIIKIIINEKSFIIKDNGKGIKKENLSKIFDKFYRENSHRDNKGFGLGLSLVKKILDLNSWKITIKSEFGVGTEIKIEF